MGTKTCVMRPVEIRSLSRDEINWRIESLGADLTAAADDDGGSQELGARQPRWIRAGELVRRMRPFLVLN